MINRRHVLSAGAAGIVAGHGLPATAQAQSAATYPNRPIRIIVPFPPGGSTDPVARMVGQKFTEAWGQSVIVDNRPGGNTIIGSEAAARAPNDGYTLLYTASTHVINSIVVPSLPYDSYKDFQPVASLVRTDFLLVIHPSIPANNLQEFIAYLKSRPPGQVNYAISGNANPNHLAGEYFSMLAGVKMTSVPYKGGGPAVTDLLSGQVQAMFVIPTGVISHVKAGKLRALAYGGEKPLGEISVPSFAQAGLPAFDLNSWQGIWAPGGTPRPIVDKLAAELGRIVAMPDIATKLTQQGQAPFYKNADQFTAMINADRAKYGQIIKVAGIKGT